MNRFYATQAEAKFQRRRLDERKVEMEPSAQARMSLLLFWVRIVGSVGAALLFVLSFVLVFAVLGALPFLPPWLGVPLSFVVGILSLKLSVGMISAVEVALYRRALKALDAPPAHRLGAVGGSSSAAVGASPDR